MGQRRKFSAEYKREAVAMLDMPGVSVKQIAADLGIGATVRAVAAGGPTECEPGIPRPRSPP